MASQRPRAPRDSRTETPQEVGNGIQPAALASTGSLKQTHVCTEHGSQRDETVVYRTGAYVRVGSLVLGGNTAVWSPRPLELVPCVLHSKDDSPRMPDPSCPISSFPLIEKPRALSSELWGSGLPPAWPGSCAFLGIPFLRMAGAGVNASRCRGRSLKC